VNAEEKSDLSTALRFAQDDAFTPLFYASTLVG
jgi:hypothetical protein